MMSQDDKFKQKLGLLKRKEEEDRTKELVAKYHIPYIDLSLFPIETDALKILSEEEARSGEMAAFQTAGKDLKIAVENPEKNEARDVLKSLENRHFSHKLFLASRSSLEHAWSYYQKIPKEIKTEAGTVSVSDEKIDALLKSLTSFDSIRAEIKKTFLGRTTEALEVILAGALAVDASDVHIEPGREGARLRFRVDGVLQEIIELPLNLFNLMLSRIKLVSEMKLNIRAQAQDGRFTIKTGGTEMEVRTSTLPGPAGENVVLRILNPKTIRVRFEDLGLQPWVGQQMEKELTRANGMILTTGPTGSGKTTTLYAFLQKKHTTAIKIITIEDPIEYHLKGIEQTQVEPEKGYTFTNGLRAIVRQDPDVILVGEIRDLETAETAMHASLTGHLVFSTLHTNNAAGTIPRLLDLGVKPAIIAPAINVAMAQRLVRKLCAKCRARAKPSEEEIGRIKSELRQFPKTAPAPAEKEWIIFKASKSGCSSCYNSGYKGRMGIFEIILIDEKIEKLIMGEPSEFEVQKEAEAQGQITMRQDGLLKILKGLTDFEELERVIGA